MGFFKRLFKKKKGGTRVGNLLREIAYNASDGMIGKDTLDGETIGSAIMETFKNVSKDLNKR